MAEIIKLEEHRSRLPRRDSEPTEARILLFTGVRYERLDDWEHRPEKRTNGTKRKKS